MVPSTGVSVGAAICRPPRCNYNPCGQNGTTSRHVIPTEMKWSGGIFPSCWFYFVLVLCPTWWIPPLRLRCGRNDKPEGWFRLSTQVVFVTFPGTAHRPFPTVSLEGVPFNRTGYNCNAAGGKIAAPTCRREAVPFNHTGCIRNAPGTVVRWGKKSPEDVPPGMGVICWRCRRRSTCWKVPSGCRHCAGLRWPC